MKFYLKYLQWFLNTNYVISLFTFYKQLYYILHFLLIFSFGILILQRLCVQTNCNTARVDQQHRCRDPLLSCASTCTEIPVVLKFVQTEQSNSNDLRLRSNNWKPSLVFTHLKFKCLTLAQ